MLDVYVFKARLELYIYNYLCVFLQSDTNKIINITMFK